MPQPVRCLGLTNEKAAFSINQSKQICIAPCVASESEAHTGGHKADCLRSLYVNVNVKRAQIVDIELATDSNSDATISSENYQNYIMWCCIMCITHKKH